MKQPKPAVDPLRSLRSKLAHARKDLQFAWDGIREWNEKYRRLEAVLADEDKVQKRLRTALKDTETALHNERAKPSTINRALEREEIANRRADEMGARFNDAQMQISQLNEKVKELRAKYSHQANLYRHFALEFEIVSEKMLQAIGEGPPHTPFHIPWNLKKALDKAQKESP